MAFRKSVLPLQGFPVRVYGPVGTCIYCGALTRYQSGGRLTDEHAIPLALEGQLILREASCESCRIITHSFETRLLKGILYAVRLKLDLKGRKRHKQQKPKAINLIAVNGDESRTESVLIEDHPGTFILPLFPPCLRLREPDDSDKFQYVSMVVDPSAFARLAKRGITSFHTPTFSLPDMCRFLAKIAHCYAVADLGLDIFTPTLTDLILGHSEEYAELIGGPKYQPTAGSHSLWELHHAFPFRDGKPVLVTRFRIFGAWDAPAYEIVAGEFPGGPVQLHYAPSIGDAPPPNT